MTDSAHSISCSTKIIEYTIFVQKVFSSIMHLGALKLLSTIVCGTIYVGSAITRILTFKQINARNSVEL